MKKERTSQVHSCSHTLGPDSTLAGRFGRSDFVVNFQTGQTGLAMGCFACFGMAVYILADAFVVVDAWMDFRIAHRTVVVVVAGCIHTVVAVVGCTWFGAERLHCMALHDTAADCY